MPNESIEQIDLTIIGGGPAGMAAALVAGRAMLKTVIINAENPRNAITKASHGYLTRDGVHPLELLRIGKEQLAQYNTVTYIKDLVTGAEKKDTGFVLSTQEGVVIKSERIMFATGLKEDIPSLGIKGLEEVYGKSVFPCPFCDGWEHRNLPLALIGSGEGAVEFAKTIANWSNDLIIFTNGESAPATDIIVALNCNGIRVETGSIASLKHTNGALEAVVFEDKRQIERHAGFLLDTAAQQATDLPEKLGVTKSEYDTYEGDTFGKTNVEGIYVVGDTRTGFSGVIAAAAEGSGTAEMIVHEIINTRFTGMTSSLNLDQAF